MTAAWIPRNGLNDSTGESDPKASTAPALSCVLPPAQKEAWLPAAASGRGFTVTVTWSVSVQPFPLVTCTVWKRVVAGERIADRVDRGGSGR